MNAKKMAKILKEIEDSSILVEYLMFKGVQWDELCCCFNKDCFECRYNDDALFTDKKVKEAREWKDSDGRD